MINQILPPATIGIVGGGQLGRMMAQSAKQMGYTVGVLDPTPNAPAAQVADFQITADYADTAALLQLAKRADVLTYEFENVDRAALTQAEAYAALPQGTRLLAITSDRLREKTFVRDLGIPTVKFAAVPDAAALDAAVMEIGLPAILKTTSGGYDGHGQIDLNTRDDLAAGRDLADKTPCILERRTSFIRELSVMVTRDGRDEVRVFPIVENRHRHHILHTTIAPAQHLAVQLNVNIKALAAKIATALDLRGVLGIELFETSGGILVNELAPRPHNSGHYTIEACNFSQFDAHILSICGLPIEPIRQLEPAVMRNLLGDDLAHAKTAWLQHPEWHFHDYGKGQSRPGRKMGHLTVTGPNVETLLAAVKLGGTD